MNMQICLCGHAGELTASNRCRRCGRVVEEVQNPNPEPLRGVQVIQFTDCGPVIACDLDTGDALAFMLGENGQVRLYQDEPLTCRLQFHPPLTISLDFSG